MTTLSSEANKIFVAQNHVFWTCYVVTGKKYSWNAAREFYMFTWYLVFISIAPKARYFNHNEIDSPGHREIELEINAITDNLRQHFCI